MIIVFYFLGYLEYYFFMVNLKKIIMVIFFKYIILCNVIVYYI